MRGQVRFEHEDLTVIARSGAASRLLDVCTVARDCAGVLFIDGKYVDTLAPGLYAFWRDMAEAKVVQVDLRETMVDVSGQEIMTADKVTLRMNALGELPRGRSRQGGQLDGRVPPGALPRSAAGTARHGGYARTGCVPDRQGRGRGTTWKPAVRRRADDMGLEVVSVGIRDVIMPGDMKDLMNKVTEAKKAAEANLIARREETAAMRSQANTAKLLAENPTLMRLRELEVLEKIAVSGNLK